MNETKERNSISTIIDVLNIAMKTNASLTIKVEMNGDIESYFGKVIYVNEFRDICATKYGTYCSTHEISDITNIII